MALCRLGNKTCSNSMVARHTGACIRDEAHKIDKSEYANLYNCYIIHQPNIRIQSWWLANYRGYRHQWDDSDIKKSHPHKAHRRPVIILTLSILLPRLLASTHQLNISYYSRGLKGHPKVMGTPISSDIHHADISSLWGQMSHTIK